ncbi:MAG: hypothetical protein MH204_00595, partial [Fimbriimonadaceae bacterium]|nr:hypothetical protein [Fimbriimonadaceae bacterium]
MRLVNPLGRNIFSSDMLGPGNRYAGDPTVPAPGTRIGQNSIGYWDIFLNSVSDAQLAQMDMILLQATSGMRATQEESARLHRYVNQGGTLWYDLQWQSPDIGGASYRLATLFGVQRLVGTLPISVLQNHPLTDGTFAILPADYLSLQTATAPRTITPVAGVGGVQGLLGNARSFASETLRGVIGNAGTRLVGVRKIGAGWVVMTSSEAPLLASRATTGNTFVSGPLLDSTARTTGAKLAMNMADLGGSSPSVGATPQGTRSIKGDVGAPLMLRSRVTGLPAGSSDSVFRHPVIVNGRVLVPAAGGIVCLDARPDRDLDGDGNPDDGQPDIAFTGRDVIWTANLNGGVPLYVEAPHTVLSVAGRQAIEQVWIPLAGGSIVVLDLLTGVNLQTIPAPNGASGTAAAIPLTESDGLVYQVTTNSATGLGMLRVLETRSAAPVQTGNQFVLSGSGRFDAPTAAPTVGLIPINDASGGQDIVLYSAVKGAAKSAGITSIWLGAKAESPVEVIQSGSALTFRTRASLAGLPIVLDPASRLGISAVFSRNGDIIPDAVVRSYFTNVALTSTPGELRLTLTAIGQAQDWNGNLTPSNPADDVTVRLDYTLDIGRANGGGISADNYVRGDLQFPDTPTNARTVVGSPVIAPNGNLVVAVSDLTAEPRLAPQLNTTGSTVYVLRETARGDFDLLRRFDLNNQLTFTSSQGATVLGPTLIDQDLLLDQLSFLPALANPPIDLRVIDQPMVKGDTAYVLATGFKSLGFANAPTSVVVALDINPRPAQFEVVGIDPGQIASYSLVQPDPVRSANKAAPDQVAVIPSNRLQFETGLPGNVTRITVPSMMSVNRGLAANAISSSLPVILRGPNGTDTVIQPEATAVNGVIQPGNSAGRWVPVRWYAGLLGVRGTVGPVASGNTMYVGGNSVLPSILTSGFSGLRENGLVFGIDTSFAPNDPFLRAVPSRPGFSQIDTLRANSATPWDVVPNPGIRWPETRGITSLEDFRIRILQNTLEESTISGIAVGENSLATYSGSTAGGTITVFGRSDFLIADNERILRVDPAGNPLWVLTGTRSGFPGGARVSGAPALSRSLAAPSRVRLESDDSIWVVDPPTNRVIQLDGQGREIRSIEGFSVHPSFIPEGFKAAESRRLSLPKDVLVSVRTVSAAEVNATFGAGSTTTPEVWRSILIADSGNRRSVELVDRYALDATGTNLVGVARYTDSTGASRAALGLLYWKSPEEL